MSTRRDVIRLGALASAGALAADRAAATATATAGGDVPPSGPRSRDFYVQRQGEAFEVRRAGLAPLDLRLVDVADPAFAAPGMQGRADCFRVMFEGPASRPLPQGTAFLAGARRTRFAVFLVPLGVVRDGVLRYEASFNRTVGA
jgi:hypothetical protein